MNWKLKSLIQRSCAALPGGGEAPYYLLQKTFGTLRKPPDPLPMMQAAAEIVRELNGLGFDLHGKRVMEVGTGRRIDMPLAFYLCGAARTDTFDLHAYLKPELVMASVRAILERRAEVSVLFAPLTDPVALESRFEALASAAGFAELVAAIQVGYHAPADAASTALADGSVDLQFSYTVFEHIPRPVLVAILKEAGRLLSPQGLACHHIDPSDHFAHEDPSISFINFLRLEESEWQRYGSNQFAYHNRLRVTDYRDLYHEAGHEVKHWVTARDERSARELAAGFPLASPWRSMAPDVLATTVVRVISRGTPFQP
jgi:SAM-dependent methyltransferase